MQKNLLQIALALFLTACIVVISAQPPQQKASILDEKSVSLSGKQFQIICNSWNALKKELPSKKGDIAKYYISYMEVEQYCLVDFRAIEKKFIEDKIATNATVTIDRSTGKIILIEKDLGH